MAVAIRKSGIDLIGDVSWGTHFCQFYQTQQDLIDILIPFFMTGLQNNELCMWVTADNLTALEARNAISAAMPDFSRYVDKGQIEILPYSEWYLKDGTFDSQRVLNGWVEKVSQALLKGYDGLRLTGNTFWLEKQNWRDFTDYEEAINNVIGKYKMIALCTYSLEKCDAAEIIDVIRNHEFALIKQSGKWQLFENSRYAVTKDAFSNSEKRLEDLYRSMSEGLAQHEIIYDDNGRAIDYIITGVNPAYELITGLKSTDVIGKQASTIYGANSPPYLDIYSKVTQTGQPTSFETYFPPMNKHFTISVFSPGKGKFATLFSDITERKQTEQKLLEQATMLENAGDAIIGYDASYRITYWNPGAKRLYGYTAREALGQVSNILLKPEYSTTTREELINKITTFGHVEAVSSRLAKDGRKIDVETHVIATRNKDGETTGYVVIDRDVTTRKKMEVRLAYLASYPEMNPNIIVEFGVDGNLEYANPAARAVFPDLTSRGIEHPICAGLLEIVNSDSLTGNTDFHREVEVGGHTYDQGIYFVSENRRVRIYGRDVTARKKAEDNLIRLNRELRAISECNQAVVRASDEHTLITNVCRIMCEVVGYRMVWFGSVEQDDSKSIIPRAFWGEDAGYLAQADITWADTERGRGPTGIAARTGKTDFCQDFVTEAKAAPWREPALARGFRSSISVPLFDITGIVFAVLTMYATEANGFAPPEIKLLEELADDLSFGIMTLRMRYEHARTEESLHISEKRHQLLSETNNLLLTSHEPEQIVREIALRVMKHIDCDAFFNFILAESEKGLRLNTYYGIPEEAAREIEWLDLGVAICGCVARDGQRIVSENVQENGDIRANLVRSFGIKAYASYPLRIGEKTIGTLSFGTRKRTRFTEDELDLIEIIAGQVSVAMQRKKAEAQLRETSEYLTNLLDYANAPIIVWDPQFRITQFNPAFERLTGYKSIDVIGSGLDILFPKGQKTKSLAQIKRTLSGERWNVVEISILRKDGAVRTVLWNSANVYDSDGKNIIATIAQGQDITERKQAEEQLRETTDYLNNLLDYANAPIVVWNPNFRITRFNHAFERLTGIRDRDAIGKPLDILFPEESKAASMAHIRKTSTGERWETVEIPIARKDGTVRIVLWNSATLLGVDGKKMIATIAQGQDITERKQAEIEVKQLNEELKHHSAELEAANQELEAFSYSVSHDLRAPLRSMEGFSHALLEDFGDILTAEGKDYLKRIQNSAELMSQLIDDLLRLSRLIRADMVSSQVDLSGMIKQITADIKETAPKRKIKFVIAPGLSAYGDEKLIKIALQQLLENAWKFTGKVPQAKIEFGARELDGKRVYFIRDNGVGFDMNYANKLYKPFQRLHSVSEFPGTGIGLASVHRIILRHGGNVWAEGKVGQGATFYFTLGE